MTSKPRIVLYGTISAAARGRLLAWNDANPQHKQGRHSYSLEQYGLTKDRIESLFRGYIRFLESRFPT